MSRIIQDLTGRIDCIFFDLDGVFIDYGETGVPKWLVRMIREEAQAAGADDITLGQLSSLFAEPGADYFRQKCTELGIDRPTEFWNTIHQRGTTEKLRRFETGEITAYDDVSVVEELSELFDIAVISNQPRTSVEQLLRKLSIHSYVDAVVGFEGLETNDYRKPNPGFLLDAKNRLDAELPAYVGDSTTDVEAAQAADAIPVYIDRDASFPTQQAYHIQTLQSLRVLLE